MTKAHSCRLFGLQKYSAVANFQGSGSAYTKCSVHIMNYYLLYMYDFLIGHLVKVIGRHVWWKREKPLSVHGDYGNFRVVLFIRSCLQIRQKGSFRRYWISEHALIVLTYIFIKTTSSPTIPVNATIVFIIGRERWLLSNIVKPHNLYSWWWHSTDTVFAFPI